MNRETAIKCNRREELNGAKGPQRQCCYVLVYETYGDSSAVRACCQTHKGGEVVIGMRIGPPKPRQNAIDPEYRAELGEVPLTR